MPNVLDLLNRSREALLDLSFRNALLSFRLTRARGVQVVEESSAEIYKLLVEDGRKMAFKPRDEGEEQTTLLQSEASEGETADTTHLTDRYLQTSHDVARLQKRLLGTFYNARTYIEERGVSILFLALGMLHWYEEESSDKKLRAPLILVPVELTRTDARERFALQYAGGEVGSNVSLCHKLRECRISLPEIEDSSEIDVKEYFAAVEKSVRGQERWHVNHDDIVLGFFAFGKFLMYHDLDPESWPASNQPTKHPILRALLGEGFAQPENVVEQQADLDDLTSPRDTFHVVDADSSQIAAALKVRDGQSVVIQGPPGTGKSQTITNIIAQALGDGKRVLFVAEKMAALEVVKRRLDAIGLGDNCLELHSHKANKKAVLEELARTHNLARPRSNVYGGDFEAYAKLRQELNAYCEALHAPLNKTGFTPYETVGKLTRLQRILADVPLPALPRDKVEKLASGGWSRNDLPTWETVISNMEAHVAAFGSPSQNSFLGSELRVVLPSDFDRIRNALQDALRDAKNLIASFQQLSGTMNLPLECAGEGMSCLCRAAERVIDAPDYCRIDYLASDWVDHPGTLANVIQQGSHYKSLQDQYDGELNVEAWDKDVGHIRSTLSKYGAKWWRFTVRDFWSARKQLLGLFKDVAPKDNHDRLAILDAISAAAECKLCLVEQSQLCSGLFGDLWLGEESQWDDLTSVLQWATDLHEDVRSALLPPGVLEYLRSDHGTDDIRSLLKLFESHRAKYESSRTSLARLLKFEIFNTASYSLIDHLDLLERMVDGSDSLQDHASYNILKDELCDLGLDWLVDASSNWEHASDHLVHLFQYIWFESLYRIAMRERKQLAQFSAATHNNRVAKFGQLDSKLLEYNRVRLALKHYKSLPANTSNGQIGILLREFNKKRRHLPIRQLIERAGHAIQALKPIFMMSPMSIASFLSRESVTFDLVVFDEASQVRPVDAFGAVLRGGQLVVVGDDKQLPPTKFFDYMASGDDLDEDIDLPSDMESILGLMCTKGGHQSMLVWHYRSEHESLIATSNSEFYDNRLVIFPSVGTGDERVGLHFHHLPEATYDRGKSRTNLEEAREVAQAVLKHAHAYPEVSLGVAAFSAAQAEAILDELERLRKSETDVERFFDNNGTEPFFVKNLESVQGDERDVIFISIGYGKSEIGGSMSMNFGALNNPGGERRLNVLITRARSRCEVFSSITDEDIDLGRSRSVGVRAFKTFLRYARTKQLDVPTVTGGDADSTFELEVGRALEDNGYEIERQVGFSGYRIDIAVKDSTRPGRFLLAIECDGATYHSSRTARDRDRLRQMVLESRGWKFHRIWSTDWFRSRDRALRNAIEAIERAKTHEEPDGTGTGRQIPARTVIARSRENRRVGASRTSQAYQITPLRKFNAKRFETISDYSLSTLINKIVKCESPIHLDILKRRIIHAYEIKRLGSRIDARIERAISQAGLAAIDVGLEGQFLWWKSKREITPRYRTNLPTSERTLGYIAPQERWSAVKAVVSESLGISEDDAPPAVLRLFGLRATKDNLKVIRSDIKLLLKRKLIRRDREQLFTVETTG